MPLGHVVLKASQGRRSFHVTQQIQVDHHKLLTQHSQGFWSHNQIGEEKIFSLDKLRGVGLGFDRMDHQINQQARVVVEACNGS